MKLTNLIHTILENVISNVQFSFCLEDNEYNITLDFATKFAYDGLKKNHSVKILDSYEDANIIEFLSPRRVIHMYVDTTKYHFYIIKILENGEPIRLYDRSRLFFDK